MECIAAFWVKLEATNTGYEDAIFVFTLRSSTQRSSTMADLRMSPGTTELL